MFVEFDSEQFRRKILVNLANIDFIAPNNTNPERVTSLVLNSDRTLDVLHPYDEVFKMLSQLNTK